jgi:hypothetical protein
VAGGISAGVRQILQLGSPGFPRRHSDPADYLRRTVARAFPVFPPQGAMCLQLTLQPPQRPLPRGPPLWGFCVPRTRRATRCFSAQLRYGPVSER